MEPDVIRMYSSSPPPMEDGAEEEDDEFGDFGTFASVPNSVSFSEFDTPTTFNQSQALDATSPPELINNRGGVVAFNHSSSNGTHDPTNELSKANGVLSSSPSDRTDIKKVLSNSVDLSAPVDCNGGGTEVLTNGFATFDIQGSPSSQNSVHSHTKEISTEDVGSVPEGDFADFAAFSNAGEHLSQREDSNNPTVPQQVAVHHDEDCDAEQESTSADNGRDTNRTGPNTSGAETPDGSCNTDRGSRQRDSVCTNEPLTLNGLDAADGEESKDDVSASVDGDAGPVDEEKGSGNDTETETETETSFGRPLSTDALEEYGDVSTTGSAPSPLLHGDTATPADEDDEDFGDFGDASVFSGQSFADFDQLDVQQDQNKSQSPAPAQESSDAEQDDDFGDFNSPKFHSRGNEGEDEEKFADFPVSDSFGNFSSAEGGEADAGWSAFGEQQQEDVEGEGESWAAFTDESVAVPAERSEEEEEEEEDWHESETAAVSEETSRTDRQTASLSVRLEKLFQSSFPPTDVPPLEDAVLSLKVLLEPPEDEAQSGAEAQRRCRGGGVWTQLQDIHEAFGLRYQWGGSHCNKALLCCLGIDTRNILFTGQKKQPVIVPMYAAGLGMLEPTKEPVKPVSAAEMIASIGQAPPPAPEKSSCPPDTVQQEALPPVQFDWSSSGLTNPLDGVDPELFELTTAKMDASGSGSRVADAFARLMSTMEKTSTSTRKPKKDENLSEEASKVIAALPDLSFMQAKVLMFPATLTPLGSQATPD